MANWLCRFTLSKLVRTVGAWCIILIVCLEVAVTIAHAITPRLFGETKQVLAAISGVDYDKYKAFAAKARLTPAVWDSQEGTSQFVNCLGRTYVMTHGAAGARSYPGFDAAKATVLLIGDSYTAGDEAGDEQTIAARLYKRTGLVVANLGVNGYSSLQAVLKLEQKAPNFPAAKTVILGIMFENIRRNVNSYMAVFTGPDGVLALRPHVRDGRVVPVPAEVFERIDAFKAYAGIAVQTDFWATPAVTFPSTVSLVKLVSSPSFAIRNKSRALQLAQRQYAPDYEDPRLAAALALVMKRFTDAARAAKLKPIAIFVPQNRLDLDSPARWIQHYRRNHGDYADIRIMNHAGVDWARYNLGPNGNCHPSSYGYDAIAMAYAEALGLPPGPPSE